MAIYQTDKLLGNDAKPFEPLYWMILAVSHKLSYEFYISNSSWSFLWNGKSPIALELGKTRAEIQCLQGLKDVHCDGVH